MPDGSRLSRWTDDGHLDLAGKPGNRLNLWMLDPAEERPHQLTEGEHSDRGAAWVHGQKAIIFISNRSGSWNLWRLKTDTNQYSPVDAQARIIWNHQRALQMVNGSYTQPGINRPTVMRISSKGGTPEPAIQAEARHASFSPDGTLIAAEAFHESAGRAGMWIVALFSLFNGRASLAIPGRFRPVRRCGGRPDGKGLDYVITDRSGVSNLWYTGCSMAESRGS